MAEYVCGWRWRGVEAVSRGEGGEEGEDLGEYDGGGEVCTVVGGCDDESGGK